MGAGDVRCARLAARQQGVLHREQALRLGFTPRQVQYRVRTGAWERVHPGVYRVAGAPPTWEASLRALVLWLGPDCVLSHRTAAELLGFARFRGAQALDITVFRRVRDGQGVTAHRASPLPAKDISSARRLRITGVERTLLDLSATESPDDVLACFDEALKRQLTTPERLEQFFERNGGQRGVALLKALVHRYRGGDGPTESELEARVRELLEAEGLPVPVKQQVVHAGGKARRLDFRFPGTRVVLEADGYAYHSSLNAFEKDRARANALALQGFRVLQWTWQGLHRRPHQLLDELRLLLESEGARLAA